MPRAKVELRWIVAMHTITMERTVSLISRKEPGINVFPEEKHQFFKKYFVSPSYSQINTSKKSMLVRYVIWSSDSRLSIVKMDICMFFKKVKPTYDLRKLSDWLKDKKTHPIVHWIVPPDELVHFLIKFIFTKKNR